MQDTAHPDRTIRSKRRQRRTTALAGSIRARLELESVNRILRPPGTKVAGRELSADEWDLVAKRARRAAGLARLLAEHADTAARNARNDELSSDYSPLDALFDTDTAPTAEALEEAGQ